MAGGYDTWFQQLLALSAHRRVLAVTYPSIDSLEELTRQLMGLLDSREVGSMSLVGSSLGGYIAQYLVANHPDRLERSVFANTFPPSDQIAREHSGPFVSSGSVQRTDVQRSVHSQIRLCARLVRDPRRHFPYLNDAERYNTLLEEFLG